MRLLLFDIDGTLVRSNGVGRWAMGQALAAQRLDSAPLAALSLAGKVDWGIWREVLAALGIDQREADRRVPALTRAYLAALEQRLGSDEGDLTLLPGVRSLLQELGARDGVRLALVTGNVQAAAWLKLRHVGIESCFVTGGFGDDAPERDALPAIAVERAARRDGGRVPDAVVVVGDTAADVRCALRFGARAVGVTTGPLDEGALRAAGADAVLSSLHPTRGTLAALLEDGAGRGGTQRRQQATESAGRSDEI